MFSFDENGCCSIKKSSKFSAMALAGLFCHVYCLRGECEFYFVFVEFFPDFEVDFVFYFCPVFASDEIDCEDV